ncbi:MAG: hypothetical protein Q4G43_09690 [Mobilicoccus sp.]|nr:hypothetical protein [Mobilicoccus sp.]
MKTQKQPELPNKDGWDEDPMTLVNKHTHTIHSAQQPSAGCHLTESGLAGNIVPMRRSVAVALGLDLCLRCFPADGTPGGILAAA